MTSSSAVSSFSGVLVGPHAIAATAHVDHRGAVEETVDDGGGDDTVGEDLAPIAEAAVGACPSTKPRRTGSYCHVQTRLEALAPESERNAIGAVLTVDQTMTEAERQISLERLFELYVLPFFDKLLSVADVTDRYKRDVLKHTLVRREAVGLMGGPFGYLNRD